MKLLLNATIEAISTRVDGTIKISLGSQEMSPEDGGKLLGLRNKYVKCLLSEDNIESNVVDAVSEAKMTEANFGKSQSQRLRNVIWLVAKSINHSDPEAYYRAEIEQLISNYKTKIK